MYTNITYGGGNFSFNIRENSHSPSLNPAYYRITNKEIAYEKGLPVENNTVEIEEEILAPFLLLNEEFTPAFYTSTEPGTGAYIFTMGGSNFSELWKQIDGIEYGHLPVW